ncbi:hypothetical protein [Streptomyces laurentii]|uniref:hypothetical protein n=1 Tax=Streptomyces laurentii TaxID=39478 RepID=UPI0036C4B674
MTRSPSLARRARAAALTLALVPLAAASGIQKSDVVEAGGAATVTVQPTAGTRLLLFFVGRDGRLLPVARGLPGSVVDGTGPGGGGGSATPRTAPPADPSGGKPIPADKLLPVLMEGPNEQERAAGLTTHLDMDGKALFFAGPLPGPDGAPVLSVRFDTTVLDLDPLAVRQVVCTMAYSVDPGAAVSVTLVGTDGALPATRCEPD